MPLYEYICGKCEGRFEDIRKIDERRYSTCPECGSKGEITVPRGKAPGISIFKSAYYGHIQRDPIYCRTAQDLRNACDKHGKTSVYLEDSVHKTSPGPDYDKTKDPARMSVADFGGE